MTGATNALEWGNPEICFEPAPQKLGLADGEAQIFCAALDQPHSRLARLGEILSGDEQARAARFVHPQDRNRFVACRGILREMLGHLLHVDPSQPVFVYGRHGKPQLTAPVEGRFLHFNVAHSDAIAVYIVSARFPVGIDVERIRPIREAESIMAQTFSTRQYEEWRSLPDAHRTESFFRNWTQKEALVKAVGVSLGLPLNQLAAQPLGNGGSATPDFSKFFLHHFIPVCGYHGAAATESAQSPKCWSWPAR